MRSILPFVIVALALSGCATVRPGEDHLIAANIAPGVDVRYAVADSEVIFSAHLPADWTYQINLDGDQNGVWGDGPDSPRIENHPTADLTFARSSKEYCPVYVLSSHTEHPDFIKRSSNCGQVKSAGSIEITPPDHQNRMTLKIKVPTDELFGSHHEAHLQVCLWDGNMWTCRYSPTKPFILKRPEPAHQ